MIFINSPKCSTCQKARKWLEENGIEFTDRDIKSDNPTYDELKSFFNTSRLIYRGMGLKDKLPTMTEEEQINLLVSDAMLVKRPLLVGDDFVLIGFKQKEYHYLIC